MYTDNADKAEILNKSFDQVFTHDDGSPAPYLGSSPNTNLPSFEISIDEVRIHPIDTG